MTNKPRHAGFLSRIYLAQTKNYQWSNLTKSTDFFLLKSNASFPPGGIHLCQRYYQVRCIRMFLHKLDILMFIAPSTSTRIIQEYTS